MNTLLKLLLMQSSKTVDIVIVNIHLYIESMHNLFSEYLNARKTNDKNRNTLKNSVDVSTDKINPSTIYVVHVCKKVLLKADLHHPATVTEIGSNYVHLEFVTNIKRCCICFRYRQERYFCRRYTRLLYLNCNSVFIPSEV